ncbi:hypothetical protein SUNI508_02351 [Seiridium unicorne]|uniref:Uncharacterized protein n=1 Tax=Seiridium unicorne TaxID=138068 RepID=A0ABR2UIB3_9PEZI
MEHGLSAKCKVQIECYGQLDVTDTFQMGTLVEDFAR